MNKMKPILFNTDMVRAILEGRKTVARRVIKPQPVVDKDGMWQWRDCQWMDGGIGFPQSGIDDYSDYQVGDTLYVRETFCQYDKDHIIDGEKYAYKANATSFSEQVRKELGYKWKPSIHMPKEAARVFLRVTDVRAERLQEIEKDPPGPNNQVIREGFRYTCDFIAKWEAATKPKDRDLYGWFSNPWVWVIEFECISKEDAVVNTRDIV